MSALNIRLPESLNKNAKVYASLEGISVNQLISTALAEKMSALATEDYLEKRAARGNAAHLTQPWSPCPTPRRMRPTANKAVRVGEMDSVRRRLIENRPSA